MSIPSTQSAIVLEKTGGSDVLDYRTNWPVPTPKEGELLVKNEFIGINYIDIYFRSGLYKAPSLPYILGREGSGVVVSTGTGELYGIKPGDRVAYMNEGAYQEYSIAPAFKTFKLPDDVSSEDAAAGLLQGLTAWTLLTDSYPLQKGEWALVHAATGGVGQWLVQIAKHIGAHVIALVSTSKIELAKSYGADVVVDYTKEDYAQRVKEITHGAGVPVIYDSVGKDSFEKSMAAIARKGTFVSYGNASGPVTPFPLSRLSEKNIKVLRPTLYSYIVTREEFETRTQETFDFLAKGIVKQKIHEIYPLKDAGRAQDDLASRKTTGKLLLKP